VYKKNVGRVCHSLQSERAREPAMLTIEGSDERALSAAEIAKKWMTG